MNHRHNLISINTDGNDFKEEFKIILDLIELNDMKDSYMFSYPFHQAMELEFGVQWRAVAFIIFDACSSSTEERLELLKCLKVNLYREGDEGFDFV
jgi:hypothetical protein